ncbi:MAG: aldehyde ferredoxin oxidoreductase family protein [Chloroflexi bacterium]|nr:aldehyde ferredoxin oxidoreductase family protein [Chloroflexota bacterium]
MLGGYTSKILKVDLTTQKVEIEALDEQTARKYLGGDGFAAKILWETTSAATDPFSPENPVIFMTGPLTGTIVPTSARHIVAALSPLTNIWGAGRAGGHWGAELKRAGFDGVVVTGKSTTPVYLWVHNGQAQIADARHVWGKDTWETDDILRKETDARASVSSIGQAGERLVRMACVMSDGKEGRAAARCGMGAVMGSKNLKAIVARGTTRPRVADEEGLKRSIRESLPPERVTRETWVKKWREHRQIHWNKGRVGIKNWLDDDFPSFLPKLTEEMVSDKSKIYYCPGCRYSCTESHTIDGRRCQVYESMVPLGALCLIDDMDALQEAYDLCNRYGMDAISVGGVVAFAMEAFENGLITSADTGGIRPLWGDAAAMVEMVRQIGESDQKFARLLGQGVRRAAETIGGVAPEFAIHVKGLELPAHDPRSSNAVALEYATANIGAWHQSASGVMIKNFLLRELALPENQDSLENRFRVDGRGELVAKLQNFLCSFDCLALCKVSARGTNRSYQEIAPSYFAQWLSQVTGWDVGLDEFMKMGERVFNLERMINVRRGISRKDDTLPPRMLAHKRGSGAGKSEAANHLPPLGEMLNQYYSFRGWNELGIPTREKLADLGLEELTGKK